MDAIRAAQVFVKVAGGEGLAHALGRGVRATGRGAKALYNKSGEIGGDVAKGLGHNKSTGELVGKGVALGTAAKGGQAAKNKYDEWQYRRAMRAQGMY